MCSCVQLLQGNGGASEPRVFRRGHHVHDLRQRDARHPAGLALNLGTTQPVSHVPYPIRSNPIKRRAQPDPIQSNPNRVFLDPRLLLTFFCLHSHSTFCEYTIFGIPLFEFHSRANANLHALHSTFASLRSAHSPELNAPRRNAVVCSSCDPMTMSYCTINCVSVSVIV